MALLIKADGTEIAVVPEGEGRRLTYAQVREAIGGGYVEAVATDPAKADGYSHIYLDEEGKLKRLPANAKATAMSNYTMPGDVLCGDVLFCTSEEDLL